MHGSATGYAGNYGVASGATLGGSGAINFATTATSGVTVAAGGIFVPGYNPANGAVSPANSTLSVTTNGGANGGTALTLAGSASQFDVSLTSGMAVTSFNGSSAPTGGYAFLNANGSIVNLDGLGGSSAGATLIVSADGTVAVGQSYLLIDPSSRNGSFTASGVTSGSQSLPYTLTYLGPSGNNDVVLTIVPEPSSWALASLAALGAVAWRLRRRRSEARA